MNRRPLSSLLLVLACGLGSGCGLSRASVEGMRHESDPVKAAAHLDTIAKALAADKPQPPDLRCALLDVGCALALRHGGASAEAVRAIAQAEIDQPRIPAEGLVGLDAALARDRVQTWAAYAVARYAAAESLDRLIAVIGDPGHVGGEGMPRQAAALLGVLNTIDRVAADPTLSQQVLRGALTLAVEVEARRAAGTWSGGTVERQLAVVFDRLFDAATLAATLSDDGLPESARLVSCVQARSQLARWVAAGAVPAAARSAVPGLGEALRQLALGPDGPLRVAARDVLVEQLPYLLLVEVPVAPVRQLEAVLLLPRLGALAAHRPVGDLRLGLGLAAAVIDPGLVVPGLDLHERLDVLVLAACADLARFQGEDRWMVLEILATWTPAALGASFAGAWQTGAADVATAADWLAAMRIARTRNGSPAALAQLAQTSTAIVGARPPGGDPEPLWHLYASIADGFDNEQIRGFSAVLSGAHGLDDARAATAARFLVAALERSRAAASPLPAWADGIAALRHLASLPPLPPTRVAAPFLLANAPGELIAALIARSDTVGHDEAEAVLLMDTALRASGVAAESRRAGLAWLGQVCSSGQDDDVRHAAARSILELDDGSPADRALVAVAVRACPVFAQLAPKAEP